MTLSIFTNRIHIVKFLGQAVRSSGLKKQTLLKKLYTEQQLRTCVGYIYIYILSDKSLLFSTV